MKFDGYKSMLKSETRKVLYALGGFVALVVMVQYFEHPYGAVSGSFFSLDKFWWNSINNRNETHHKPFVSLSSDSEITNGLVVNGNETNHMPEVSFRPDEIEPTEFKNGLVNGNESNHMFNVSFRPENKPTEFKKELVFSNETNYKSNVSFSPENEPTEFKNDSVIGNETNQIANVSLGSESETSELKNGLVFNNGTNHMANVSSEGEISEVKNGLGLGNETNRVANVSSSISSSASHTPKEVTEDKNTTAVVSRDLSISCENPMLKKMALVNKEMAAVPVSEMKNMLHHQNLSSYLRTKPLWPSVVDQELLHAKSEIQNAALIRDDPELHAPIYLNVSKFKRSYELMEQTLKVYIYNEGEKPVFHQPELTGIYASEGWFMRQLKTNTRFVTKDPSKAHLFYLPFSSYNLERKLYVKDSHSFTNLIEYLRNYLDLIKGRYSFWNRTWGADHFVVACHDWAAEETRYDMANCIRSLCNADLREGLQLGKDVSLPETYVRSAKSPLRGIGGNPPSKRPFLAFFAGQMHGYLRPILLKYWENKDPEMKIFGHMSKNEYSRHMKSSKYCICARGFEVNSPRVVEAITYECVPVIISDNFIPPFLETLDWESFAVFVPENDIPNLKNILKSIPETRYREMHKGVKHVQRHFLWHSSSPQKYDLFHMILHSIWYTRVFRVTN